MLKIIFTCKGHYLFAEHKPVYISFGFMNKIAAADAG